MLHHVSSRHIVSIKIRLNVETWAKSGRASGANFLVGDVGAADW